MSRRIIVSLVLATGACLSLSLVGCERLASPSAPHVDKPAVVLEPESLQPPSAQRSGDHRRGAQRNVPGLPMQGRFKQFEPAWFVSHFTERMCNSTLLAGAELHSEGIVNHLGRTDATASAAWDWADKASGKYEPQGPETNSSATILGSYPYAFCSRSRIATGEVLLVAANGDELRGVVAGGEVYELGYRTPGDGQEQFLEVEITGGSGRFASANGFFVIHSIAKFDRSLASCEILPGGSIRF